MNTFVIIFQNIIWKCVSRHVFDMERQSDIYSGFTDISNYLEISQIQFMIPKIVAEKAPTKPIRRTAVSNAELRWFLLSM